jgi:hypothetical protein
MRGFLTTDVAARYDGAVAELVEGSAPGGSGTARTFAGIESAPGSIAKLYEGASGGS